jgi:hypothetical protein
MPDDNDSEHEIRELEVISFLPLCLSPALPV